MDFLCRWEENTPCEKCLNGSVMNCFKHKSIHSSGVKSLLGVIEALLYKTLKTYNTTIHQYMLNYKIEQAISYFKILQKTTILFNIKHIYE